VIYLFTITFNYICTKEDQKFIYIGIHKEWEKCGNVHIISIYNLLCIEHYFLFSKKSFIKITKKRLSKHMDYKGFSSSSASFNGFGNRTPSNFNLAGPSSSTGLNRPVQSSLTNGVSGGGYPPPTAQNMNMVCFNFVEKV
jgi:hypothetical protein